MIKSTVRLTLYSLILSSLFVACNNDTEPEVNANTVSKPAAPTLPAMNLQNSKGEIVNLGDFKGKKLFVNLWATWCPPCRAEMPSIQKLAAAVDSSKVEFVMLSLDEQFATAQAYAEQTKLDLPIYGPASGLPRLFQTPTIPVTFVFDENGELIFRRNQADNYYQPRFIEMLGGKAE